MSASWGPAHLQEGGSLICGNANRAAMVGVTGGSVISGNANSAAMVGATGGGSNSDAMTAPYCDAPMPHCRSGCPLPWRFLF